MFEAAVRTALAQRLDLPRTHFRAQLDELAEAARAVDVVDELSGAMVIVLTRPMELNRPGFLLHDWVLAHADTIKKVILSHADRLFHFQRVRHSLRIEPLTGEDVATATRQLLQFRHHLPLSVRPYANPVSVFAVSGPGRDIRDLNLYGLCGALGEEVFVIPQLHDLADRPVHRTVLHEWVHAAVRAQHKAPPAGASPEPRVPVERLVTVARCVSAEDDTDQRVDADGTRTGDHTIPVDAGWLLELRAFGTPVPAHVLEPFCLLSAVKAAPIA